MTRECCSSFDVILFQSLEMDQFDKSVSENMSDDSDHSYSRKAIDKSSSPGLGFFADDDRPVETQRKYALQSEAEYAGDGDSELMFGDGAARGTPDSSTSASLDHPAEDRPDIDPNTVSYRVEDRPDIDPNTVSYRVEDDANFPQSRSRVHSTASNMTEV